MSRRAMVIGVLAAAASLLAAPAAQATFHEISIREVYAGSLLVPGSQYVELQMWSSGQEFVNGHVLRTYDAGGTATSTSKFTQNVSSGASQSTILIGTAEVGGDFGVAPDAALDNGAINAEGGAVCWEALDCVSWGDFDGSLPSPAGSPAPAIPQGMALRRTIAPLCATALDAGDDHDNSAADFSVVFPAPRPNSVPPSEIRCAGGGGGAGGPGGSDTGAGQGKKGAPQTALGRKPGKRTFDRTPTFRFSSNEPGSTFQCKLDAKPFRGCKSPFTAKTLSFGPHTFKVRARDKSGQRDPSPASYAFKVVRRP